MDKEIVEVTANSLGWCHLPIDVNIVTIWESGISFRQHAHLYAVGYLQFIFYRGFSRRCRFQVFHIGCQRLLHVFKRVAQLVNLIVVLDGWQLCVEMTLSHHIGCICQHFQRFRRTLDDKPANQEGHLYDDKNHHQHE